MSPAAPAPSTALRAVPLPQGGSIQNFGIFPSWGTSPRSGGRGLRPTPAAPNQGDPSCAS